jgi:hypothetical protein
VLVRLGVGRWVLRLVGGEVELGWWVEVAGVLG